MKPASNRGEGSSVVLLMEREHETGTDWDEAPITQPCVYVQDRASHKWTARAQRAVAEVEPISSAE